MIVCPHCGAENADNSEFCSLCLARFNAGGAAHSAQQQPQQQPYVSPGDYRALTREMEQQGHQYGNSGAAQPPQQQPQPYVSPGDYRALAQEMAQQNPQAGYRDSAYYGAAMSNPGAVSAIQAPAYMGRRSTLDIVILLAGYSFVTFILLITVQLFISMWLLGAAFGGSEAGFTFGIALIYIADALLLILGGYAISAKAMHAGKGWLYGAACTALVIFVWQPLAFMILALLMTGEVFVPIFTLAGVLVSLFLYLPLGALGGWIAEKRLMG